MRTYRRVRVLDIPRREFAQEGHVERGGELVCVSTDRRLAGSTREETTAKRRPWH